MAIVNNFSDRLEKIEQNKKEINYELNSDDTKLEELITSITDKNLLAVLNQLKDMNTNLYNLIDNLEKDNKIHNDNSYEWLKKFVKESDWFFDKMSKQNLIISFFKKLFPKENIKESKQLTKQEEIDEAMDVMVELLNSKYSKNLGFSIPIIKKIKNNYPNNKIIQWLQSLIWVLSFNNIELKKIEHLIKDKDKRFFNKIAYSHINYSKLNSSQLSLAQSINIDKLYYSNYSDLEKIFTKYEEFLKMLYFQDYSFEKSKYTNNYQKILYKKWEFYFDKNTNFENFTKNFFEKVWINFNQKQLDKKNIWERLQFEIIDKNNKTIEGASEINNIFDIKIWDDLFQIYIINPIWDSKNKIVTIWTDFDNSIEILQELMKVSNEQNIEILQNWIKKEVEDILIMNFEKNNISQKINLLKKNWFKFQEKIWANEEKEINYEKSLYTIKSNNKATKLNNFHNPSINYEDTKIQTDYFLWDVWITKRWTLNEYFLNKYIVDFLVYWKDIRINESEQNKITFTKKLWDKNIEEINHQFNTFVKFLLSTSSVNDKKTFNWIEYIELIENNKIYYVYLNDNDDFCKLMDEDWDLVLHTNIEKNINWKKCFIVNSKYYIYRDESGKFCKLRDEDWDLFVFDDNKEINIDGNILFKKLSSINIYYYYDDNIWIFKKLKNSKWDLIDKIIKLDNQKK